MFYIWYASRSHIEFETALINNNLEVREQLIWNKSSLCLSRQDYHWKHEPCLYGWNTGTHHWYSDRKQTTVIDWERPAVSKMHPTMKPIGLLVYEITNSSKPGEWVADTFCGSGSTLLAAEVSGRKCYAMELDPHYCDVIIHRWEKLTGKKAVKL